MVCSAKSKFPMILAHAEELHIRESTVYPGELFRYSVEKGFHHYPGSYEYTASYHDQSAKMVKKRIDGRRLAQNVGEQVILLGTVANKSSNGKNIELKTTDGASVNVTLPEPLDSNVEGYLEVHGTLQSKSTMSCSSFVNFPVHMTDGFDVDQYNEMIVVLNVLGDKKWRMSENDAGFV
ncbi:hypothetical protein KM043_007739 [Ampulex compressa]|nr:hypothetical protein KM043_007739 [Ampulex compressa]